MARVVLDLERYVPGLLTIIANKLSHGSSSVYRELFRVGATEWRILSMLAVEPDIRAQRICEVTGLDKALVSRVVQVLAERGLVSVKSDAKHRRRHVIRLTPDGQRMHDRVILVALEREKVLLSDLSPREIDTLVNLLQRLLKKVDAVNAYRPRDAAPLQEPRRKTRRKKRLPQAAE